VLEILYTDWALIRHRTAISVTLCY